MQIHDGTYSAIIDWQDYGIEREPPITASLDKYNFMYFLDISPNNHRPMLHSLLIKGASFSAETIKESQNCLKLIEQLTSRCPHPTDTSTTHPLTPKALGIPQKRDRKIIRFREPGSLL